MGCDIHGFLQDRRYGDEQVSIVPHSRNYTLFAALAGVRNYDEITPLCEPRGLPADFVYDEDKYDLGDHSFTWLTLKEILEWSGWDQKVHRTRYVGRTEYERMLAAGETSPQGYCMDVWGSDVIKATLTEVLNGSAPEN